MDSTSIIVLLLVQPWSGDKKYMESSGKFFKEYSTPSNPLLPCFCLEVVLSHHCNHTPCIVVGQGRVVVVVMVVSNAHYPSFSLKNKPKKVSYNHQLPERWLCVKDPSNCRTIHVFLSFTKKLTIINVRN